MEAKLVHPGDAIRHYPVVLHTDVDGSYGAIVPDIKGCYSAGGNLGAVLKNVVEAIECHLEGLLADNIPLPLATPLANWVNAAEFKDGIFGIVPINISRINELYKNQINQQKGNKT
jgi:predicted RNase H-like HicB family nuclease